MKVDLNGLAAEINAVTTEKGFWKEGNNRNKAEMVMLMVSELGEALQAHRKNKRSNKIGTVAAGPDFFAWFEEIKDSVEDEIADVFIRVLDYCYGWGYEIIEREYRKLSTGNFGHDLLRINWYIINAYHESEHTPESLQKARTGYPGKDWGYVIAAIEALCSWYSIDLMRHVLWKMKYNSKRPVMHGKKN